MDIGNTFRTTYLVDLENIGPGALFQHMEKHQESEYVVFYSDATAEPGTLLRHISVFSGVRFVDCRDGGNNAMDFCICAMAGQFSTDRGLTVVILSGDKGYDPMIRMLNDQGTRISREPLANQPLKVTVSSGEKERIDKRSAREQLPAVKTVRASVQKKYQDEVIEAVLGAAGKQAFHEELQTILPTKQVQGVYKKLKKYVAVDTKKGDDA